MPDSTNRTKCIILRPEGPEDQEFLFQLYASTRAEEMKRVLWQRSQSEAFLRMQFKLQATHYHRYYPDASFQVILCEGHPVGRLYVHREKDLILLIDVALLPEHRGMGIGGQLLRELLSEAGASQKSVAIHVERENPALRLYTGLGFRLIEEKGMHYYMEWSPTTGSVGQPGSN